MEGVTVVVFRHIVSEAARSDVFFTEFTNSESYCHLERKQSMRGIRGTSELRHELMSTESTGEVRALLDEIKGSNANEREIFPIYDNCKTGCKFHVPRILDNVAKNEK